jgi:hypothetical protein
MADARAATHAKNCVKMFPESFIFIVSHLAVCGCYVAEIKKGRQLAASKKTNPTYSGGISMVKRCDEVTTLNRLR